MHFRDHIALAWFTGALFGAVEVVQLAVLGGAWEFSGIVLGAVLAGLFGALLGVAQALASRIISGLFAVAARLAGLFSGTDAETKTEVETETERKTNPRVARRALGIGLGFAFLIYAGALTWVFGRLRRISDLDLALGLQLFAAVLGALVALAFGLALGGVLLAPLGVLARRWPFPWLGLELRVLMLAGLGAGLALFLLGGLGSRLGVLAWAPFGLLFICVEVFLAVLGRRLGGRFRSICRVALPLALLGSASVIAFAESRPQLYQTLDTATRGPWLGRELLRRATDVDRDGFGALAGGGDCAAFDSAISPLAREVAGNGIDEDCDGLDGGEIRERGEDQIQDHFFGVKMGDRVRDYDVVWIIVDALRADHISGLGYKRPTTPYLDQFAEESLVFTAAYSQSSATMLSIPSMLSGRSPLTVDWEQELGKLSLSPSVPTLGERLRERGYRSAFIVSVFILKRLPGLLRGFDEIVDASSRLPKTRGGRRASASSADAGLAFIHRLFADPSSPPPPYFLTVYFEDPHRPYSYRAPDFGQFTGPYARYDQEIAATDRHIGFMLESLRLSPRWDQTVVIITADHGEEFLEHGGRYHARTCYEESVHVPLLVRIPGIAPRRVDLPVALVDVLPTLVELIGLDRNVPLDGQSLLIPAFEPSRVPLARSIYCAILSQTASQGHFLREAVRSGTHLLIRDVLEGRDELYDRALDPQEKEPLALDEEPARSVVERLRSDLQAVPRGNLRQRLLTR
ncbi:MAG TPA: hypothetical protein ENJ18_10270 [Nannocystis exedens]|nr:hypothetical protein [Nannocystis exedens]